MGVYTYFINSSALCVCVCGCEKRKWRGVYVLIHNTCERISMGSVCVGTSVRVQILFSQSGWRACGNMFWKVEGGFTCRGFRTCKQELFCNKHPPRVPRLYFFFLGGSKNRATLIWQPHVHCGLCLLTSNYNQEHIGAHCRTWPQKLRHSDMNMFSKANLSLPELKQQNAWPQQWLLSPTWFNSIFSLV